MRKRIKSCRKLCVICMTRNCYPIDSEPVHGTRALKKSKPVTSHKTKMFRNSFINPDFINHPNGELIIQDDEFTEQDDEFTEQDD